MSEEARGVLRAGALMVLLTVGSYALLRALPGWELQANGWRERAREQLRAAREWNRQRNEVLFEAYTITREAAPE